MKKSLIIIAFLFATVMASAQSYSDGKNWYVGLNAGAQVYNGMNDSMLPYGQRIGATVALSGGKWVTTWLAIDANFSASHFKGLYTTPRGDKHFTTDKMFQDGALRYQNGVYTSLDLNARFDLVSAIRGWNPELKHHVMPYVGTGLVCGGEKGSLTHLFNTGLQYRYDIKPYLSLSVDLRNTFYGLKLENEGCKEHPMHNAYGIGIGLVYNIGR